MTPRHHRLARAVTALFVTALVAAPTMGMAQTTTELAYGIRTEGWAAGAGFVTPTPVVLKFGSVTGEASSVPQAQGLGAIVDWGFVGGAAFVQSGQEPPTQAESSWPSGREQVDKSAMPPVEDPGGQFRYRAGTAVSESHEGPRSTSTGGVQELRLGPEGGGITVRSALSTTEVLGAGANAGRPTAVVTTRLQDVDIAGAIHIDEVVSRSQIGTDGNAAEGSSRTTTSGVYLDGNPVTLDDEGITIGGEQVVPGDALSSAIAEAGGATSPVGVTVRAVESETNVDPAGGSGTTSAGGVEVVFRNEEAQQTYTFTLARTSASVSAHELAHTGGDDDGGGFTGFDDFGAGGTGGAAAPDPGAPVAGTTRGAGSLDVSGPAPSPGASAAPSPASLPASAGDGDEGASDRLAADTIPVSEVSLEMEKVYLGLAALALAAAVGRVFWWRLASTKPSEEVPA